MGVTLDLSVLLAFAVVGPAFFAIFEVETPAWRKVLKWGLVIGLTLARAGADFAAFASNTPHLVLSRHLAYRRTRTSRTG